MEIRGLNPHQLAEALKSSKSSKEGSTIKLHGPIFRPSSRTDSVGISSQPTQANQEARAQLDDKVSSTGIKYSDAEKRIQKIRDKYKNDENVNPYDPTIKCYGHEQKRIFTPYQLPEPDRSQYYEALCAKLEIEMNNSELVEKAGNAVSKLNRHERISSFYENQDRTKMQEAAALLDTKKASNDLSYRDAKVVVKQMTEKIKKYRKDNNIKTLLVRSKQNKNKPYTEEEIKKLGGLSDAEVKQFVGALNALKELEKTNYALLMQAGNTPTNDFGFEGAISQQSQQLLFTI